MTSAVAKSAVQVPPKSRRVLRLPQVIAKAALGRDSIYRGAREGWFPKPFKLSERASGWFEDEVDAFLEMRAAQRDSLQLGKGHVNRPVLEFAELCDVLGVDAPDLLRRVLGR